MDTPTAPTLHTITIPAIGAFWPAHGGHFAGIVAGGDSERDYALIVGAEAEGELNWEHAVAWAKNLRTHDFDDWALPTRREQAVLFGNAKTFFDDDWCWSGEQYAGNAEYAWCQGFNDGYQDLSHELNKLRARAVRRVTI